MVAEGAGERVGEVFEGGLGEVFCAGGAGGGGVGGAGRGGDAGVFGLECREVGHEVERRGDVPDGLVFGFGGDVDAGAGHVELVGDAVFHGMLDAGLWFRESAG